MASTQPNESSNLFYRKTGSIEITVARRFNRTSVGLGQTQFHIISFTWKSHKLYFNHKQSRLHDERCFRLKLCADGTVSFPRIN